MEKQIFKFGDASLALIIPKKWAVKKGLEKGSKLFISENEEGDILLSTHEKEKREKKISIDDAFNPKILGEIVGRLYMYGINLIKIQSSDRIKPRQINEVEKEIKNECPGFEIVSQSENELTIKDFTDLKQISIEKLLERIIYLISQQLDALEAGDKVSVKDIEEIIDRLYMVGFRYVNIIQPNRLAEKLDLIKRLETLSDNLETLSNNDKDAITEIKELKQLFVYCVQVYKGDFKAIIKLGELREKLLNSIKKERFANLQKNTIGKIAGLMLSISEFGILSK